VSDRIEPGWPIFFIPLWMTVRLRIISIEKPLKNPLKHRKELPIGKAD
jgi:hypothetical protein